MKNFDIIVIGSGGGSKITRPAAALGYQVAIVEEGALGGTCLNRGCIPSKMLIHPAEVVSEIVDAEKFDIHCDSSPEVNVKRLVERVSRTVDEDSASIKPVYDANPNITLFQQRATFVDKKVLKVGDELITAPLLFVAVGARPYIPEIPGLSECPYWTSTEALRATKLPKSLVIIGGGYIACELGYYFREMGVDVTFIVRSHFIKYEDHEIIAEFERVFSPKFNVIYSAETKAVEMKEGCFYISYEQDGELHQVHADQCLVATGVIPNSDRLNAEQGGIRCNSRGYIEVDDYLESSVEGVYAFGDVIGRYSFRHSANFEGQYLFDCVVKDKRREKINYPPIPSAVFTNPQVASVGLTENQCKEQGIEVLIGKNDYKSSAMGMALLSDHGFVKLIFERSSQRLIGAHIIGREASNMIHMLILGMNMKVCLSDLLSMVYIHPALPEIVRNAARNVNVS